MKLEFEQNFVPEALGRELDFSLFLGLFDLNIPLIPSKILKPMDKESGTAHFAALGETEKCFTSDDIELLTGGSRELPNLDSLLPFFESATLEQYHLFELGSFLTANGKLVQQEKKHPVAPGLGEYLNEIHAVLSGRTEKNFSVFSAGEGEAPIRQGLYEVETSLKKMLLDYEEQIFDATGLKMIYPYPKEVPLTPERAQEIKDTNLLSVTNREDLCFIDYQPGEAVSRLIEKRDRLTAELSALMQAKLEELNGELIPFYDSFKKYYDMRKKRTWLYTLLFVKNSCALTLPVFTSAKGCTIEKGVVYSLKHRKKEKCVPLDITIERGSNVLYGANMSGKTTVLKTVYFLLTAIRAGLPVPAEAISLNYPEDVSIMLKSSGNLNQDLSSFGEEISFFTGNVSEGAYILSDELFLSTDPVNGAELSGIFIREFAKKEIVFFCTTHYPQVLDIEDISLFRMCDPDLASLIQGNGNLEKLLEIMPYMIEKVSGEESLQAVKQNRKPLEIAMLFPLPEGIREKIRQKLDAYS